MLFSLALFVILACEPPGSIPSVDPCEEITTCPSLQGNSSCGAGFNCVHSASVECNGAFTATVTYDTTCSMPPPQGGTASTTTVKNVLLTDKGPVTNDCNCKLTPSLNRSWGEICCQGEGTECFNLACN